MKLYSWIFFHVFATHNLLVVVINSFTSYTDCISCIVCTCISCIGCTGYM